jgi:hypothetical protein
MLQMSLCAAMAILMCAVGVVQAHFIWVEYDSNGPARAYFGE